MYELKYDINVREFRLSFNKHSLLVGQGWCFRTYKCYAIHDYYPIRGIENDVDNNIRKIRSLVYRFKDGSITEITDYLALLIAESVKKKDINIYNACLAIIPASTPEKTQKRFNRFCALTSSKLNIINGFEFIKGISHEQTKGTTNKNILPFLTFNSEMYKGRDILLFDDVYTTGSTFEQIANRLIETGAKSVIGLFLAKTTRV